MHSSRTASSDLYEVRASIPGREVHLSHRSNWLRAAVLGANDGILSTASLVLGVAASGASGAAIVTAGSAGLVAGALSMAAGARVGVTVAVTLIALALLGDLGARLGGAPRIRATIRVLAWGASRWRSPLASGHSSAPSPDGPPLPHG
jgi:VIT1/CCC1 family predicted Fe2+/Mn2+ transporter